MIPRLLVIAFVVLALGAPAAPALLEKATPGPPGPIESAVPTAPSRIEADTVASPELAALARMRTPFRIGGAPSALRWGEAPPPPPSKPIVERPRLLLSGILWGRERVAIVEGIPGQDHPLALRPGESAGDFRVMRIEPSRVTITGQDTVWTLEVRNPWP